MARRWQLHGCRGIYACQERVVQAIPDLFFARGYEAFGVKPCLAYDVFRIFHYVRQSFKSGGFVMVACCLEEVPPSFMKVMYSYRLELPYCFIVETASGLPNSEVSVACVICFDKSKHDLTNDSNFPLRSVMDWRKSIERCIASVMSQVTDSGS